MSCNELHVGRLKKVDLHGKSIEEWAKEKLETDFPKGSIKIHQSGHLFQLLSLKSNYIHLNDEVYELIEHYKSDETYFNEMVKEPDGTFRFFCSFYNGGTYLGEMLEESLEKLKNGK